MDRVKEEQNNIVSWTCYQIACENMLLDASLVRVNTRLVTISGYAFSHSGW